MLLRKTIQEDVTIIHLTAWWLTERFPGVLDQSRVTPKLCVSISYLEQCILKFSHANFPSVDLLPQKRGYKLGGGWVIGQWAWNDETASP